jgi:hypothetical protein
MSVCVSLNISVFYAHRDVSKGSRRLVLPKTSCISNKFMHSQIYAYCRVFAFENRMLRGRFVPKRSQVRC